MTESRRGAWWAGRLALAAVLLAYFFALRLYSRYDLGIEWVDGDLGYRAAQTERIMHGQLLYRDFWAPYPPLPYYVNVALFRLFGVALSSFRIGLALVGAATTFLAYVVTRRVASRTAALVACALCVSWSVLDLNVNYSTWYCVPLALGAAWAALVGGQTGRRWPWLVAGAFAGLTLSFKITYGLFVLTAVGVVALAQRGPGERPPARLAGTVLLALAGLGSLAVIHINNTPTVSQYFTFGLPLAACAAWAWFAGRTRERGAPAWPRLWLAAAGAAAVFAPWVVYFAVKWDALAYLHQIIFAFAGLSESVNLPPATPTARTTLIGGWCLAALLAHRFLHATRPRAAAGVAAAGVLGLVPLLAYPPGHAGVLDQWLFTLVDSWVNARSFLPVAALWVALGVLWSRRRTPDDAASLFAVTVFAAAVLLTYYPYSDVNHLLWAWPPQAILACVLLDRFVSRYRTGARALWLAPVLFAATQWFLLSTHFYRSEVLGGPWQAREFREAAPPRGDVLVPAENAAAIQEAVRFIQRTTGPDTPLLEMYGHCLGFLADRPNPTRRDYFWPGFLDEQLQRDTIAAIEAHPPLYVVGHRRHAGDDPMARFVEYFPLLGAHVRARYRPLRQIGPYVFYVRRAPTPAAS